MGVNRYISDCHFGHQNIMRFDGRPFGSVEEMDNYMIEKWNSVVEKDDTVYIIGDFCWGLESEWVDILSRLSGRKVLIMGNHDLKRFKPKARRFFIEVKDYKEVKDDGRRVILSHYPMCCFKHDGDSNVWHLHGHTHRTQEQELVERYTEMVLSAGTIHRGQMINVGCMFDHINYVPRTLDELIEYWKKRWNRK